MLARITEAQATARIPVGVEAGDVLRDLALSRTHLEDALTRFNSAQYRLRGTWDRRDPEKA